MGGAAGNTWGISGPTFLLAYLVLATAVWVAGARERRALADVGADRAAGDLAAHPYRVAHLNGGPELAVYSALSAMHLAGTIVTAGRGSVQAVGRPGPEADPLERAVHTVAAGPVATRRVQFQRPVQAGLRAIEDDLVAAGLLLSAEQRRRIREVGWWMAAVAALGLVRVLAGIAAARPVGYLVLALAGVAGVALYQLTRAPRRTRAAEDALSRLRREHHALSPDQRPDWAVSGPAGAALGVGMFGTGALWAADPTFADELAVQKVAGSTSAR
ncbi:MAG TPA: TIGR04222 domain-containing membrane protein [Pseudonocardia sp.]|nr:TIGR04222 domain-containing membrane protein [Pseudonocardia sp.]